MSDAAGMVLTGNGQADGVRGRKKSKRQIDHLLS